MTPISAGSPGGRSRPALPSYVHVTSLQLGPVRPSLQENQSNTEHLRGETQTQRGAAAQPGGSGEEQSHTDEGQRRDSVILH